MLHDFVMVFFNGNLAVRQVQLETLSLCAHVFTTGRRSALVNDRANMERSFTAHAQREFKNQCV